VLFVDLVGFTAASENRDAEDTREFLTRYFDIARRTIERYGGTVEKFIGDAVMALWGAPVAQEDDAERAVRAALEIVGSVTELDPDLRARAGVLSGEAAVTVGATGQGMVAGDLVNAASRIQSVAAPGSVFVGDSTKHATEAAIAYDDAGEHALKGKASPVHLWRALRIVGGVKGALRYSGLEAPFVGRDRELRLVKELFHGSTDEHRAQLALVTGIAGIGKSRLAWEFEKYVDGLAEGVFWHRGRCLSYGEGVAYWALAEMVRMRCGIAEEEESTSARAKLRVTLEQYVSDAEERAWIEPRLGHLLGLEEGVPGDQENLFPAWRILFERLAEESPTVLLFEDLQWADAGLLDFIEYLLDWSRSQSLFVLALARPEFAERRPGWGSGKRSFSSLYLEPLSAGSMGELLDGLAPGLPEDLRQRILARAEGVPLYAVETVRMLLDRELLTRDGNVYQVLGDIDQLEVPDTLHALVAARLDALPFEERRLVECGAVLGKTFTRSGLAEVSGVSEPKLEPLLAGLLGKEILAVQADPRSPDRGHYSFLQDIVKQVAYETISKRERKAKHLAAAQFLASAWSIEEDEIVEVVAAHYLDAYRSAPDDEDALELKAKAFEMLVRAGERAASLGANTEAQRAYERASGLTDDELARGELLEKAGMAAYVGGRVDAAAANFERAIQLFQSVGATHPAARVAARDAEISWDRGRIEQGLANMDRAFSVLSQEEPDADLAALAAQIGRFMLFAGQPDLALERIERSLEIAEMLSLHETLAQALNTKGILLIYRGRPNEGLALLRIALDIALQHGKPSAALRAYYNLADLNGQGDYAREAADLHAEGLALARKVGNRYWEWSFIGTAYPLYLLGVWDEVIAREVDLPEDDWRQVRIAFTSLMSALVPTRVHRGQVNEAAHLRRFLRELETSADVQEVALRCSSEAIFFFAEGAYEEALDRALTAFDFRHALSVNHEAVRESFVVAVDSALALGDNVRAEELLAVVDSVPVGLSCRFLKGHSARFHGRLAASDGDSEEADRLLGQASGVFRQLGYPFWLGVVLVEHGELLVAQGNQDGAEVLLTEAREIFERLQAMPWLDRVAHASAALTAS
jgi:class 3 adenylate cyclase/tetratricopeptide (TPR) repeat protein